MSNRLALTGGEEFSEDFEAMHAGLIAALGQKPRVAYLPTAAAHDGMETPRVVDAASANEELFANQIAEADWVYLGGGYAHVALPILEGTKVMEAILSAKEHGTLISGASAGAMMMGTHAIVITPELLEDVGKYWESGAPLEWDPPAPPLIAGLNWLPQTIVAPHFDRPWFSRKWLERDFLPDGFTLIGIDERTTVTRNTNGKWEVFGFGSITLWKQGEEIARYTAGDKFEF